MHGWLLSVERQQQGSFSMQETLPPLYYIFAWCGVPHLCGTPLAAVADGGSSIVILTFAYGAERLIAASEMPF